MVPRSRVIRNNSFFDVMQSKPLFLVVVVAPELLQQLRCVVELFTS